ncbi:MAG TPA: recombinase family protein [Candidatus Pacearchaeota archaeon]|nr:recombinase family protein [Candidatus Pacearchaeota archaeon]HPR79902.1 recombinase family protein [Candidatus Pacearchaeota archaeon]
MKAIIVARVSTDEQKENSPDAQIFRMQEYCNNRNLTIIEKFSFIESAYKTKRDEFDKIIETINSQKEKVAVCFDKVDRLSRNIFDKRVSLLYEKAINNQIELHFVSDGQVIDANMSAGDKFAFGMKLGLSKYYSDAISDNVKRAFEQKRRNGEWTGTVRLGYLNIPLDEKNRLRKNIIIDPERGHLLQKMFELYATNQYSLETIRTKITELGLKTLKGNKLSKSGIDNILKDSFYCGTAISKKYGSYPHKYPRLITRELFDKCQEVRTGRCKNIYKAHSKDFVFKGLIKCQNCGCTITGETHEGKPTYYSCTNGKGVCKRVYVNEKDLLRPIYEVLERFETITEETQNGLVNELRKNTEAEVVFHKAQINRIMTDCNNLKIKQDRLLDAYIDQSITKDIYDKKHQEYQDKIQTLEIEMSEHRRADYEYQTTIATVISVARRAKTIFENSSDVAGKRTFLSYLLQNPTLDEKKLCFTIASPFNLVLELADCPNWLRW